MKNLYIIAAVGNNMELGCENCLIWRIPEDLKFFKEKTTNNSIIMGRKTFESLPKKLPNREHIVLTRSKNQIDNGIIVMHDVNEVLEYVNKNFDKKFYVIGGEQIYKEFIDYSDTMYLTEINDKCNNADAFFPNMNNGEWTKEEEKFYSEQKPSYKRVKYIKKGK